MVTFLKSGALGGSNAVTFDENGNMVIKELISNLNARGHVISSAVLTNAILTHGLLNSPFKIDH